MSTAMEIEEEAAPPPHSKLVLSLAHLLDSAPISSPSRSKDEASERALLDASILSASVSSEEHDGGAPLREVHLILTGSPRPTFAETNAHLLERMHTGTSYEGTASSSGTDRTSTGKAIVSRGKDEQTAARNALFQGTIDRPGWTQTRWTDGECLFGDLVDRIGLEEFEAGRRAEGRPMMAAHLITLSQTSHMLQTQGHEVMEEKKGHDDSDALLATILEETSFSEIARDVLRILRRRKVPPVSSVSVVLPQHLTGRADVENGVKSLLTAAWKKMEAHASLIGQPVLLAGANIRF